MIKRKMLLLIGLATLIFLPGCAVVAGIFAAGFWTFIILAVVLCAIIWMVVKKSPNKD